MSSPLLHELPFFGKNVHGDSTILPMSVTARKKMMGQIRPRGCWWLGINKHLYIVGGVGSIPMNIGIYLGSELSGPITRIYMAYIPTDGGL